MKAPDDDSGWPALIPLNFPDLPRLDVGLIPGWAGDFALTLSNSTETPPELPAGLVIGAG